MKKRIERSLIYVVAVILTVMAVKLINDAYGIRITDLIRIIVIGIIIVYIYTILHELMHSLAAQILGLKLIYAQAFNIRYFFLNKKLKISRKHLFHGSSGSCFALPGWYNTTEQWLGFIVAPLLFNVVVVVAMWSFRYSIFEDNTVFNIVYYISIAICVWSLIPLKETDAYYVLLFFLRKKEFQTLFQTHVLHYAQVFSEDLDKPYYIDSNEYLNQIKNVEVRQDYLEAVLTTQSLRIYQKGKNNCMRLPEVLEKEIRKIYSEGDTAYKCSCLFYLYISGEFINVVGDMYKLFEDELDSSKECVACILHLLLNRCTNLKELEASISKERKFFEELGIHDAYCDLSRMYKGIANNILRKLN